jgi:hypothetical protein
MRMLTRKAALFAATVALTGGGFAAGPAAAAPPPGYWTACSDPDPARGAYAFKHHNASCATARRLARTFSIENSRPEGWDCNFWKRPTHNLFRCTKVPGNAPWAVTWRKPVLVH